MRKPELLIPASSLEVLKTAVIFGADAVYIGGETFSLRAKAKNFSHEDMKEGIAFAHAHGVRVHVTANILADVIIPLSAVVRPHMAENGIFISSGIIDEKADEVETALLQNGFTILEKTSIKEWVCFVCK